MGYIQVDFHISSRLFFVEFIEMLICVIPSWPHVTFSLHN